MNHIARCCLFLWIIAIWPLIGVAQGESVCSQEQALVEVQQLLKTQKFAAALVTYNRLLNENEDSTCLSYLHYNLGKVNSHISNFALAINNFHNALRYTPSNARAVNQARILSKMSMAYNKLGNFDEAYNAEMQALRISEREGNTAVIARSQYQLGTICFSLKSYEKALEHYRVAKTMIKSDTLSSRYIAVLGALGSAYLELDQFEEAIAYLQRSADLAATNSQEEALVYALGNLAITHGKLGHFELSLQLFEESINRKKELQDQEGMIGGMKDLGLLWIERKKFAEAKNVLENAAQEALDIGAKGRLLDCYAALTKLHKATQEFDKAYDYLEKSTELKDEILNERSLSRIETQETIYESEKKEAEIHRLKEVQAQRDINDRLKRTIYLSGFLVFFLIFLFGININRKLKKQNEELESISKVLSIKNEELENFTSIASHDLKEPLRTIKSFINLLERKFKGQLDESARDYMNFIHGGIDRMQNLLEDLLMYSRVDKNIASRVEVNSLSLLQTAIGHLDSEIKHKEAQIFLEKETFPDIKVIPSQMIQVFQNLIGNAVKYTNGSQPLVWINWEHGELEGSYRFSIKDNGIGIDPAFKTKIFEMFTRLHNSKDFEGTGIGLATCQKIVELYDGRIWVDSQEGSGANFYFTIQT